MLIEFLDESYENSNNEIKVKPILAKSLNLKLGISVFKKNMEEKKRQDKIEKGKLKNSYSLRKWQTDTENLGIVRIKLS